MIAPAPPEPPVPAAADELERLRFDAAAIISIFSLALLLAGLVFSYLVKNETLMTALVAVIATNATTVVGYYVGSSASSQKKDAIISAQLPPPQEPTKEIANG